MSSQAQEQMQKQKLDDFVDQFIAEHAIARDGERLILDVTPQEAEELGLSFIRVICGWAAGLDQVRILREADREAALPVELLVDALCRRLSGMERRIMQRLGESPAIVEEEEVFH